VRFSKTVLVLTVVALLPLSAHAATLDVGDSLIPAGLGVGDTFHILFVTSTATQMNQNSPTTTPAQFADAHVNAAADAGGSLLQGLGTWKAMASFDGYATNSQGNGVIGAVQEHARDRALVSAPVYRPDGVFLATGFADLWDGDIALPADGVGPNVNELGTTVNPNSWTWSGSTFDGFLKTAPFGCVGGNDNGEDYGCGVGPRAETTTIGFNTDFLAQWIDALSPAALNGDENLPFYGLSEVITITGGGPGDFDNNGVVDGNDFLKWQRDGLSPADLALWQANYGATGLSAATAAVPEPASVLLIMSASQIFFLRSTRRLRNQSSGRGLPL
jgi:hypothetical protein